MKKKSDLLTYLQGSGASTKDCNKQTDWEIIELPHKLRFRKLDARKSGIQGKDIMKSQGVCDTVDNHPKWILTASGQTSGTSTLPQSIKNNFQTPPSTKGTLKKSTQITFQKLTCSVLGFLANRLVLQANGRDLTKTEEAFFTKFVELQKPKKCRLYSLKMLKDFYQHRINSPLQKSSVVWLNWGIAYSGKCLTVKTLVSHRTGKECLLSAVLEKDVSNKYFLSDKAVQQILKHKERHQKKGNGFGVSIKTIGKVGQDKC